MASTYSTNLGIELITTGEQAGTWGTTTNTNLGTLIEQAISGYVTQAITDGSGANTTITMPDGATGVARNMFIEMTGALTFSTTSLIVPADRKLYFIFNNTTGGFAVTVKVTGLTGVSVPNGRKVILVCNGTDIVEAHNAVSGDATVGGTLAVTGATTLTGAATLSSTLGVTGATTLSTGLTVTGGRSQHAAVSEPYAVGVKYSSAGGSYYFGAASASATPDGVFSQAGGSERVRITDGGFVGIGTGATVNYRLELSTDSAGKPGVGGLWTVVSDERIKTDIVPANLDRCYEIVKSVPLKHFGFAEGVYSDDQISDKHNLGWIAQDVQKVFNKAVSVKPFTLKTGEVIEDCLDLNSGQMIAALYGAVQALINKVELLENAQLDGS